jgi:hypothetical protein
VSFFRNTINLKAWLTTYSSLGAEIVTLSAGRKRKEFKVHKSRICEKSEFFSKAFTGKFKEGEEGVIYLPEDAPDVVALFIEWVYQSSITFRFTEWQFYSLVKLYVFAQKICVVDLADRVMNHLQKNYELSPTTKVQYISMSAKIVGYVYKNTQSQSKLRDFCLHVFAWDLCRNGNSPLPPAYRLDELRDLSYDFLMDYIIYLSMNRSRILPPGQLRFGCTYHSHTPATEAASHCPSTACQGYENLDWESLDGEGPESKEKGDAARERLLREENPRED